jgi:hypothetical protein
MIVAAGVLADVVVALGTTRYVEPLLFGIPRTDATTYLTTAGILVLVTLVTAYLPSRQVTRVDPVVIMRGGAGFRAQDRAFTKEYPIGMSSHSSREEDLINDGVPRNQ